jgi:hypothetical protein
MSQKVRGSVTCPSCGAKRKKVQMARPGKLIVFGVVVELEPFECKCGAFWVDGMPDEPEASL